MSGEGAFGFGKSKTRTGSQTSTFTDPAQQPFLDFLRTSAQSIFEGQQQPSGGAGGIQSLFGLADQLGQQGQAGQANLSNLGGQLARGQDVGFGQGQAGIDALTDFAQTPGRAEQFLTRQAAGQNPFLQQNIDQLGADLNRNFFQNLNPAITSQAIGGGQLGGGRQGVAQGLGLQATQDAFGRASTQLRSDDLGRQLQASTALGGLEQSRAQAGNQLGVLGLQNELGQAGINQQGLQSAAQAQLGGLGELQNQFNLGFSPFQSEFFPAQSLAGIFGPPTVLSQGTSFGRTDQFNIDVSGGGGIF